MTFGIGIKVGPVLLAVAPVSGVMFGVEFNVSDTKHRGWQFDFYCAILRLHVRFGGRYVTRPHPSNHP